MEKWTSVPKGRITQSEIQGDIDGENVKERLGYNEKKKKCLLHVY